MRLTSGVQTGVLLGSGQSPDEESSCEIPLPPLTVSLSEEELMAKDKPGREAKKPKKKSTKVDPASRREGTSTPVPKPR